MKNKQYTKSEISEMVVVEMFENGYETIDSQLHDKMVEELLILQDTKDIHVLLSNFFNLQHMN